MSRGSTERAGGDAGRGSDSIRVEVRSYFSPQHLWAARHFAHLAADFERDHAGETRILMRHRAYVMAAVTEAVAFVEAFINEMFQDAVEGGEGTAGLPAEMISKMADYWRDHAKVKTEAKYRMARALAGCQRAEDDQRPHDDVRYLIKLRNLLVHYSPRTLSRERPETRIDHVRPRFKDNPFLGPPGGSWFPDHALSAGCAAWAVESAHQYVTEFVADIGSTWGHHNLEMDEAP